MSEHAYHRDLDLAIAILRLSEIAASSPEKLKLCRGCRDDFYNGHNPLNVKRCWSLESAEPVIRFRIGTWTTPTQPGAFTELVTLSCHHEQGASFYKDLPAFAIDPVRLRIVGGRLR